MNDIDDIEVITAKFKESFQTGDTKLQQQYFEQLDMAVSESLSLPEKALKMLLDLLQSDLLMQSAGASILVKFFEYNLDVLVTQQKNELFDAIKTSYRSNQDPAALILMLEILVDGSSDNAATVDTFTNLVKTSDSTGRAILPYGLKYLTKKADNQQITQRCLQLIEQLATDKEPSVRSEAFTAKQFYLTLKR